MMDSNIISGIIGAVAGLAGTALGALVAYKATISSNKVQKQISDQNAELQRQLHLNAERSEKHNAITSMISKMIEFGIDYPTVEKAEYCEKYPNIDGDPNGKARYECYCCHVFNTVAMIWEFSGRNFVEASKILHIDELIRKHWRCWQYDKENLGYEQDFRTFIQSRIDDLQRRGSI